MKNIQLPAPLLNQIVRYLSTRPYAEVSGYLKAIEDKAIAVEEESDGKATETKKTETL